MTPSLRGCEAFSTLRALTRTSITWALSLMQHKSQVSLRGSPCVHGVASTPHEEVRDKSGQLPHSVVVLRDSDYNRTRDKTVSLIVEIYP